MSDPTRPPPPTPATAAAIAATTLPTATDLAAPAVLPSPAPSPSKPSTTMTSSPAALAAATAATTAKRKRDNYDDGRDDAGSQQQPPQQPQPQQPLRPLLPRTTTIALHTAPPRPSPATSSLSSSSSSSSTAPRFSFIAPRPRPTPASLGFTGGGAEIDGTPPYLPFVQTAGLAFAPFVAGGAAAAREAQDGGGNSPRTYVANRFRSLAIAGGLGGEANAPASEGGPEAEGEIEGYFRAASVGSLDNDNRPLHKRMKRDDRDAPETTGPTEMTDTTPPVERIITDPLRASLTWQDNEITVYDPNDADDDGTGVNGIGFKPTPAMAHARALKRRQQLAAYRKREEREARARRSLQRTRAHQEAATRAAGSSSQSEGSDELLSLQSESLGLGEASLSQTMDDVPRTPRSHAAAMAAAAAAAAASLSSPPSSAASPSVRRVRFLETGPVTIRFKEPDAVPSPTSILSS